MRKASLAALLVVTGAGQAIAAPVELGGTVSARVGYGTNPFLRAGQSLGSGIVGGRLAPVLTYAMPTSTTTLSGVYDREQYFRRYGGAETLSAGLAHRRQLTERLAADAGVSYTTSTNPFIGGLVDQDLIDPLTIGTRNRRLRGNAGFTWQATGDDSFSGGITAIRSTTRRSSGFGDVDFYSGFLAYSRRVNARTQLGGTVAVSKTEAGVFRNVESIQPSVTLRQDLATYWRFNGSLGVIYQRTPGFGGSSTSLGFSASLCGTYPLTSICVQASRQTSASSFGGARTNFSAGIDLTQQLSELESLSLRLNYTDSKRAAGLSLIGGLPNQRVGTARLDYDRKISRRLSAGLTGRYQFRTINSGGNARGVAATANISLRIGRTTA